MRIPGICRDCAEGKRRIDLIRAAFAYRGPVPGLVYALKYRRHRSVAESLAGWMAGAFARFPELGGADVLTAVPLHPARLADRGFNQAELLAAGLVSISGKPLLETLDRTTNTRPQWRLDRVQRAKNLRLAFRPKTDGRIAGKSILLIDDVCTTGETLDNCAVALRAAGAVRVTAFVLARD